MVCVVYILGGKRGCRGVGCLFAIITSCLKLWNNGCCGGAILPVGWLDKSYYCQVPSG